jgi:predicted metal-binding membrane protein
MIAANRLSMVTGGVLLSLAAAAWYLAIASPWSMGMMEISVPLYMATWLTMLVAMMIPAVAPVVATFATVSHARSVASPTVPAFVAGYLFVWTVAGLIPLTLYLSTRGAVAGMSATSLGATAIGAALFIAGVYQFTAWKATCLRACRSPLGIVMNHDFRTGALGSFRAGASHGAFCLGCCGALMAVLTVVGLMNLSWMAALTVIFIAEKNWRHGAGLSRIAGATAAIGGLAVVAWSLLL